MSRAVRLERRRGLRLLVAVVRRGEAAAIVPVRVENGVRRTGLSVQVRAPSLLGPSAGSVRVRLVEEEVQAHLQHKEPF